MNANPVSGAVLGGAAGAAVGALVKGGKGAAVGALLGLIIGAELGMWLQPKASAAAAKPVPKSTDCPGCAGQGAGSSGNAGDQGDRSPRSKPPTERPLLPVKSAQHPRLASVANKRAGRATPSQLTVTSSTAAAPDETR